MENETKKFIVSKVINAVLAFFASLAGIFFGG